MVFLGEVLNVDIFTSSRILKTAFDHSTQLCDFYYSYSRPGGRCVLLSERKEMLTRPGGPESEGWYFGDGDV